MNLAIDERNELLPHAAKVRPLAVIVLIFDKVTFKDVSTVMAGLLKAAFSNCRTKKDRIRLSDYRDWLVLLCQSLYAIYHEKEVPPQGKDIVLAKLQKDFKRYSKAQKISNELFSDPTLMIRHLCQHCPVDYARIRLWDWLDTGLSSPGFYTTKIEQSNLLYYYQLLAGLLEAAYSLNNPSAQ